MEMRQFVSDPSNSQSHHRAVISNILRAWAWATDGQMHLNAASQVTNQDPALQKSAKVTETRASHTVRLECFGILRLGLKNIKWSCKRRAINDKKRWKCCCWWWGHCSCFHLGLKMKFSSVAVVSAVAIASACQAQAASPVQTPGVAQEVSMGAHPHMMRHKMICPHMMQPRMFLQRARNAAVAWALAAWAFSFGVGHFSAVVAAAVSAQHVSRGCITIKYSLLYCVTRWLEVAWPFVASRDRLELGRLDASLGHRGRQDSFLPRSWPWNCGKRKRQTKCATSLVVAEKAVAWAVEKDATTYGGV